MQPSDVVSLFSPLTVGWWIAGGWAIDLWLGRQTRRHVDLDVAALRVDQARIWERLDGWDLHLAHEGRLRRLPRNPSVEPPFHAVWCRPAHAGDWAFELLLNDSDGERWLFRRDHRVVRPLRSIGETSREGTPFLAPEIVLLFKAKNRRGPDEQDFSAALPTLGTERREWLCRALDVVHPDHPWLARLAPTMPHDDGTETIERRRAE
jgi:hypothetical protein